MRTFLVGLFCFTTLAGYAQFDSSDFLKAAGPVIKNQSGEGELVALRGTNLGSWLSMEYWIGPLGYGAINRDNWIVSGSASVSGTNLSYMLDGDESTKWNSGTAQVATDGQTITIDCKKKVVFDKITMNAGDVADETPSFYRISISNDGISWTEVANGTGTTKVIDVYIGAVEAQFIKVAQKGNSDNSWSIAEFYLLMNDDYSVRNANYDRFGVDKTDELWDYYQDLWITTTDMDSIKAMGMNMVRVPFYWMEVMNNDGTIKANGFKQLDWVVEQCSQREIYVMLDLHGAPGGLDGYITSGQATTNELWNDPESQQMTVDLWKAVATHFKGEPAVCAYDLMNEPVSSNSSFTTSDMYDLIYKAVRAIDPDHIISVQAFYNFDMIDSPSQRGWENMLYQAHYYNTDFYNWDSQNGFINWALGDMAWHQLQWDTPVLAGEYNFWGFLDLWSKWMNGLNCFNGAWSNWTYKNMTSNLNWGLYLGNSNPIPDLSFESEETIKAKWDKFETKYFYRNAGLIDTIRGNTERIAYRGIGSYISFEAYNNTFISSEGGNAAMTCNRSLRTDSEYFLIEDAGEGFIALKGNNGKYVSSNNGTSSMTCDKDVIGETEKFYWIDLAGGKMALLGKGGFVSMEGGSIPINANRTGIDGWEVYYWDKKDISTSVNDLENSSLIYPNPLCQGQRLNYTLENSQERLLSIYNANGINVFKREIQGAGTLDLSFLTAGIYLVEFGRKTEKLVVL
ncbi:cellulase family glycosylhydrolase [Mangrovibacterium lignilyticum]|uniref:cellulase family glycosylhydrolase n=1 Tax=Mangrovibacterium lignilyticum TaxID=2668052 RepID=UPI0013D56180|nr:cellulase family glycosylhydrolase [Mangrovibacterium lignilyticum]